MLPIIMLVNYYCAIYAKIRTQMIVTNIFEVKHDFQNDVWHFIVGITCLKTSTASLCAGSQKPWCIAMLIGWFMIKLKSQPAQKLLDLWIHVMLHLTAARRSHPYVLVQFLVLSWQWTIISFIYTYIVNKILLWLS